MRGVTYIRRSTSRQEASISDQRAQLKILAKTLGVTVVREYVDDAVSGDDIAHRLEFQRMVADASKGAFSIILVWDLDRFSRSDTIDSSFWVKPLRDAGIVLHTIAQGRIDWSEFAGRMMWTLQQEAKHQFLRDLSRNATRGLRSAIQAGVWIGPAPFGFRKSDKRLIPGPADEVSAVRRVFELRRLGFGCRTIAVKMNQDGYPHPRNAWNAEFCRQILAREAYCGDTVVGRFPCGKYERVSPGLVRVEATHEPLISRELFIAASQMKDPNWKPRSRRGEVVSIFGGMIECGLCGSIMYARWQKGRKGYCCGKYHRGLGCAFCFIEERVLLNQVAAELETIVSGGRDEFVAEIRRQLKARKPKPAAGETVEQLTKKIERASQRLVLVPDEQVKAISEQIAGWQAERDRLILQRSTPSTSVTAEEVFQMLADAPAELRNASPERARAVVARLIQPPIKTHITRLREVNGRHFQRLDSIEITYIPVVPT